MKKEVKDAVGDFLFQKVMGIGSFVTLIKKIEKEEVSIWDRGHKLQRVIRNVIQVIIF